MQVLKGIHMFGGVGFECNIYLLDGEVLFDTGTGMFFTEMKTEILNMGFDPGKIRMIVNSHCHFDHTGGDKKFRDWLKAVIAIHTADRAALEHGETLAELFGARTRATTADVPLEDRDVIRTVHFNFEVLHTPGHTPGSICLYERKRRILLSGDTLFEDGFGRTDYPGGSPDAMTASLKRLAKLDINYLLPGHGNPKIGDVGFLIKQILAGSLKTVERHR